MKKFLLTFPLFFLTNYCFAGIFGASNYEECLNDGKVGRSSHEMNIHENACRKKFPKLTNMKKGKNTKITCVFDNIVGGVGFEFNLKNKVGFGGSNNKFRLKIISITDDFIDFTVEGERDEGRLNLNTGKLFFKYVDKHNHSSNHHLTCSETK